MSKSVATFILAKEGWGKSQHKLELAEVLKCRFVLDDTQWSIHQEHFNNDTLHLGRPVHKTVSDWLRNRGYTVYEPTGSLGDFVRERINYRKLSAEEEVSRLYQMQIDDLKTELAGNTRMYEEIIKGKDIEISDLRNRLSGYVNLDSFTGKVPGEREVGSYEMGN